MFCINISKYFVPCGNRVQLTVGLLLGGRAFAVAGETPGPPLVSFGLFRVEELWLGGTLYLWQADPCYTYQISCMLIHSSYRTPLGCQFLFRIFETILA